MGFIWAGLGWDGLEKFVTNWQLFRESDSHINHGKGIAFGRHELKVAVPYNYAYFLRHYQG